MRTSVRKPSARKRVRANAQDLLHRGEFFSLGGLLAYCNPTDIRIVPWLVSAAVLAMAGVWDACVSGRGVEFILIGLSSYELLIGLSGGPQRGSA